MTYDEMLILSDQAGLITKEKDLQAYDGRIYGRRVAIRRSIETQRKKACVLAEELGHYYTSSGNILAQDSVTARKQERHAREWAFDLQIGLDGIINASRAGCMNEHDAADYLDITVNFFHECIDCYRQRYGSYTRHMGYLIIFDPCLQVLKDEDVS